MTIRIKTKNATVQVKAIELAGNVQLITLAGTPVDGGSGTGVGVAGKGSLCVDRTNGKLYVNTGTLASPTWVVAGTQT